MTELRCEMNKFMQLRNLSENTQKSYLVSERKFRILSYAERSIQ